MRRLAVLAIAAVAAAAPAAFGAEAAEAPTRPEYVDRLERICKPGSEATQRAVRGMRADVRAERLRVAAAKFARAKRIFARTVSSIAPVRRPTEDRDTLARWFEALAKEQVYLGGIVSSLRAEDIARFQRVSADFIHQGNKANNIVVSFGLNYCAFKPSRFQ
jgi:hypothetical protein